MRPCWACARNRAWTSIWLPAQPSGRKARWNRFSPTAPSVLTIVPQLVRPLHPWKDCLAWKKLTELFRARRPEIVHTHSGKAGILGRLAAARAGVPIILHTIHGPSFGPFQGPLANSLFRAAERYAARVTTHFVVVAEAMKQQYLAAGIGRPDQYTKIFSGFPLEPFLSSTNDLQLRARLGLAPDDIVIGKIARLFKLKGHDDLLAVAPGLVRLCPQIKFLLVGDGPWRGRLENQARSLGLEKHVVFTGLVAPAAVPPLVGIMDMLVHLSLREGLPRALPQALAAARPVVAYDADGAREVCLENETGFLLRPGDLPGLRERLLRLARDPALAPAPGPSRPAVRAATLRRPAHGGRPAPALPALGSCPGVSFPFNVYLLAVVSACVTVLAALPLWRKWCLRTGLVDDPGHRKIHDQPIPLAGGLAVMTGLLVPTLLACLVLWWQGAGGNAGEASVTRQSTSHSTGRVALLDPDSAFLLQYGLGRRAHRVGRHLPRRVRHVVGGLAGR